MGAELRHSTGETAAFDSECSTNSLELEKATSGCESVNLEKSFLNGNSFS